MSKPIAITFIRHNRLNSKKYIKCYLTSKQRRDLIQETSDQASMLYEYYLDMVGVDDRVFTDKKSAAYFGWTVDKAKRHRISLEKAGYFKVDRLTTGRGTVGCIYLIGKEAVQEHIRPSDKQTTIAQR